MECHVFTSTIIQYIELFLLQKSEATDRNYIKQQQKQRETERLE